MSVDPKDSVSPEVLTASAKSQIEAVFESGLAEFSLGELLGGLMSGIGLAERNTHLDRSSQDKPNVFYDRALRWAASRSAWILRSASATLSWCGSKLRSMTSVLTPSMVDGNLSAFATAFLFFSTKTRIASQAHS